MVKSDSAFYPACGLQFNGRPCNKKLTDSSGDGTSWFCERCQQQSQPDWRYILAVQVEDHTNSFWLTAFQVSFILARRQKEQRACMQSPMLTAAEVD